MIRAETEVPEEIDDSHPPLTLSCQLSIIGSPCRQFGDSGMLHALPPTLWQTGPMNGRPHERGADRFENPSGHPLAAKQIGLEGEVVAEAVIDATGKVTV